LRVSKLSFEFFIYPTEKPDVPRRIAEELTSLDFQTLERSLSLEKFLSEHGYSVHIYRFLLEGRLADEVLTNILRRLGRDLDEVIREPEKFIEGSKLFLRVDKQSLVRGSVELYRHNPGGQVKIIAYFRSRGGRDVITLIVEEIEKRRFSDERDR